MPAADVSAAPILEESPGIFVEVAASGYVWMESTDKFAITGSELFQPGSAVKLLAKGVGFDHWEGDVECLANPRINPVLLSVASTSISVTAAYRTQVAELQSLSVEGGVGGGLFADLTYAPVTARSDQSGAVFKSWSGAEGLAVNPLAASTAVRVDTPGLAAYWWFR